MFKKLLNKFLTKNLTLKKKISTIRKKLDYSYLINKWMILVLI